MNKGYSGNSTKLDKYKQEVKKRRRRDLNILRVNRERGGRRRRRRENREIRREIKRSWRK